MVQRIHMRRRWPVNYAVWYVFLSECLSVRPSVRPSVCRPSIHNAATSASDMIQLVRDSGRTSRSAANFFGRRSHLRRFTAVVAVSPHHHRHRPLYAFRNGATSNFSMGRTNSCGPVRYSADIWAQSKAVNTAS